MLQLKEKIDSLVKTGKIIDEEPSATLEELREQAKAQGIKGYAKMSEEELKDILNADE